MRYVLTNCKIFTSEKILTKHSLVISAGTVLAVIADRDIDNKDKQIDLNGHLLTPGFIDTQVNGGGGVLFNNSPTLASIAAIGKAHRAYGTTGFLPTLISDDLAIMQQAIEASQQALIAQTPGFLGMHMEGPYLNKLRKGVHCETKLHSPDRQSLAMLQTLAQIGRSIVTLAPEVVPAGFIKQLSQKGVTVAVGHSNASYEIIKQSLLDGASGFTHLYNAMSPLTSREPGVVGAALEDPHSWCGIIVDGFHVHPASLKIAIKAKVKGKIILVTDAVHTVGATGSTFDLVGRSIYRDNGKVTTKEGTLAGSDLDMASAVRNCVKLLGIELSEALRMASLYPAQFLNIDDKVGKISQGYKANLTLLDEDLQVVDTWIDGIASDPLAYNS